MPIRWTIDPEQQRVEVAIEGDFSPAEALEFLEAIAADEQLRPGFRVYSDHSGVGSPLLPETARQFAAFVSAHETRFDGVRVAVFTHNPASYGMMRMLAVLLADGPMTLRVFEDRRSAEQWLERSAFEPGEEA